jgi:excisionase family DNA binding protein
MVPFLLTLDSQSARSSHSQLTVFAMDRRVHNVMTVQEVVDFLRLNRQTLYRLIRRNKISGAFRIGSDYRFNREARNHAENRLFSTILRSIRLSLKFS